MSHAEHFLTRLDRVAGSEVELALELYRDPEMVRSILQAGVLPDAADRVAISLDDARAGPFIVVTRDGQFVTCLGRGMRPGELPVVTRTELDACARRLSRVREKLALARQAKEGQRRTRHMLRRLFESPDAVSREDFLEVAAWEPLLGSSFLDTYLRMGAALVEQGPRLRRARLRGARGDAALHDYWNLLHAAGHMALLGSMTAEREHFVQVTDGAEGLRAAFSYPLTGTGVITFILKGAWSAGRLGKPMLPPYKRALTEDVAFFELLDSLFALLALGTRSRGLRAEIQKALRAAPGVAHTPEAQRLRDEMGHEVELVCNATADLLDAPPEALEAGLLHIGEGYFEPDAPARDDDPLSRDITRTLPLLSWDDGITDGRRLIATLGLIAATARGAPEQFYLPRAMLTEIRRPWRPADTLLVLAPMMKATPRAAPVARAPSVGRNDPCPCGSGKKWKKCCGR